MNIKLLVLTSLLSFGCFNKKSTHLEEKSWRGFDGLDLQLKGVVYYVNNEIGNGYHGRGVIRMDLLESNTKKYDPRKQQRNYYAIIKNNKAEIYDDNVYYVEIGDTLLIDTKEETIRWLNEDKKDKIYSISIGPPRFFEFTKKNNYEAF